jgi:hypothetical protein
MNIRRLIYILTTTALAAGLVSAVVSCKQTEDEEAVNFLFVQYAQSVTLSEGVLTLKGVPPETLYFSDRPHRIVGRETTQKFVKSWDKGEESFSETPPNAVLAIMHKPVPLDLVVVLKDPVLEGDTLTYQVKVLEGPDSGEGEESALFIDVIDFPLLDGVRRSADRTVRNIERGVDYIRDDYGDSFDDDFDDPDDQEAYRDGYKDGQYDDSYDDDFDDSDEQDAYHAGYEDGRRDRDDRSFDDDYDDPDDQDAYREGYDDGENDDSYDDDYDDADEQDAYREGYEDGRRDRDDRDN